MDELYASARMYRQSEQFEKLDKLMSEHEAEFGNYELVNAINTRLREIATKRRKLAETKTYSTEELIGLDNGLIAERNRLLDKVDRLIERIENGEYRGRDLREVAKRISRSAVEKRIPKKPERLFDSWSKTRQS